MLNQIHDESLTSISSDLWREEPGCIEWLNDKDPKSVVYVNFGSITVITAHQLIEVAWGLANSKKSFLWIIRPDMVAGDDAAVLPLEFLTKTKERGKLELTRTSSKSSCNCRVLNTLRMELDFRKYSCAEWEMEINNDVQRGEVEVFVRELMDGEKGQKMRNKALDWKNKGEAAAGPNGQSYQNLDQLIKDLLLPILSK
ncbi:UDP-glycosyltransferase 85A8-like [Coffea arabica]|uniref:UDP-glycosyltransferase 85A8-like n=1 Tax=Coffea arabica TaxID=13443 RepID=A0A6P6TZA2_COFAR